MVSSRVPGWIIFLFLLGSCKPTATESVSHALIVRVPTEALGLNPVLNGSAVSARIRSLILPSLINYDPVSLELSPLLIDSLPQKTTIFFGDNASSPAYTFRFIEGATWPNGQQITGKDYIFSLKVAFNKKIKNNVWTRSLSIVKDAFVDSSDLYRVTVVLNKDFPKSAAYFAGFELLPEYVYDAKHLLASIPFEDFTNPESFEKKWVENTDLQRFTKDFLSEKFIRSPKFIVGAGPYRLASWETNKEIVLVKQKDYWGERQANLPTLLQAGPDTIIYKNVADELAAITLVKNRKLDLLSDIRAEQFVKLREDPVVSEGYDFYTPKTTSYFFWGLNNQSPKLTKNTRKALAKCVDLDQILDVISSGLGEKMIGPISKESKNYHHGLKPVEKDVEAAKLLLAKDGWQDNDGDGIVEKIIDNKKVPLKLDFLMSNSSADAPMMASIIKDASSKAGIQLNIQVVTAGEVASYLRSRQYETVLVRLNAAPGEYNAYGGWHSENIGKGGRNFIGYHSIQADSVIVAIQNETDALRKKALYLTFQEILDEDQPSIFLYSPVKTVLVDKRWKPLISSMRPSVFENAFYLRKRGL